MLLHRNVQLSDSVKLLGVTLDSTFSFDRRVSNVVRYCYFHIRAVKQALSLK